MKSPGVGCVFSSSKANLSIPHLSHKTTFCSQFGHLGCWGPYAFLRVSGMIGVNQKKTQKKLPWGRSIFWIRIISLNYPRRAHPHKHMNQHGRVGGLGELETGEWQQETWLGETDGRTQGKGILRDQHHLNAFEDHTVYPSALPGALTALKT